MSTLGPRLIALVVKAANDDGLPATTRHEPERLADRLADGAPLTPLADKLVTIADPEHLV